MIDSYLMKSGFLNKSFSKDNPTIFSGSQQSNFIYKITPILSVEEKNRLNEMDKYGMRIQWLKERNYKLEYYKLHSEIFKSNLELIDSRLPEILASLLLYHYFNKVNKITDLT